MAKKKWKEKVDKHVAAGGTVGLASYKAGLFGKASADEIIAYAKSKGYTLGKAWQDKQGKATPTKEPTTIQGAIKSSGSTITKKELLSIAKQNDASINQVIQKLDEVNKSLKAKGKGGIGLGASAANAAIKQVQKKPSSRYLDGGFGMGKIGSALSGMMGTPAGPMIKGQQSAAVPGTGLMIGGTQLAPGGRVKVNRQRRGRTGVGPYDGMMGGANDAGPPPPPAPAGDEEFDLQSFIDGLLGAGGTDELAVTEMPTMEGFDQVGSNFTTPDPLNFASLGQSYLVDAIRAAYRPGSKMSDFMRSGGSSSNVLDPMQLLAIGGSLGGFM